MVHNTYYKDDDKQEIYVSNIVELIPQVLWYEAQRSVLGGPDLISGKLGEVISFFVSCVTWQHSIEEDPASCHVHFATMIRHIICRFSGVSLRASQRIRSCRFSLLLRICGVFVEASQDCTAFPMSLCAGNTPGRPANPLFWLRDIAVI